MSLSRTFNFIHFFCPQAMAMNERIGYPEFILDADLLDKKYSAVDLLSQPEPKTSPDAPYVVRALVLNECGRLLMCNTDSGLCPVGGRFYGSNAFGEIPYAANAVRFLRDEAGLHYDEARLQPLPKHSLWIAMADTKRGHEVAWVLAPVESSEVVQQSDRPLCWITSADLDPNAAGIWARTVHACTGCNSRYSCTLLVPLPCKILRISIRSKIDRIQIKPGTRSISPCTRHPSG